MRANGTKKGTAEKKKTDAPQVWKTTLQTFLMTLGIGIVLVLHASLAAYFTPDPALTVKPLGIACAALTALCGGLLAGKRKKDAALMSGAWNGLFLTAAMLIVSLLFRKTGTGYATWLTALLHAGVILLSLLGAFLTTVRKRSPQRNRKRRR